MGKTRYTVEDMRGFAAGRGGACLSDAYVNDEAPLRWSCAGGHAWDNSFKNQRLRDSWCVWCDGVGRARRLTPELRDEIRRRYEAGDRVKDIRADCGVAGVADIAVSLGSTPRRPGRWMELDETRFDGLGPDGDDEALYWAGFLMADGCVDDRRGPGGRPQIRLSLQAGDADHVAAFREFLGSNHKLGRQRHGGRHGGPDSQQVRICVTSGALAAALAKVGVVPRKSHCAKALAGVERSRHFWRGAVDGDGCVRLVRTPRQVRPYLSLDGASDELLRQFYDFADANAPPVGKFQTRWAGRLPNWRNGCGRAQVGGERGLRLMGLLYRDCVPAAQRGRGWPIALARKLETVRGIEASWAPAAAVREVDSEEAASMRADGVPVRRIAAHFGVCPWTIRRRLALRAPPGPRAPLT